MVFLKSKKNLFCILLLAYLLTFVTGGVNVIPFVIKSQASIFYHSTSEILGYVFSLFMVGYFLAIVANGFLVRFLIPKIEIFITAVIYTLCAVYIMFIKDVNYLSAPIIIMGFGIGIVYTIPNYLVVNSFEGKKRSSNLNRIDFCYSLGGFAYPMLAMWILAKGGTWQMVFLSVVIVFIIICAVSLITKFPNLIKTVKNSNEAEEEIKYSPWNLNVYLMALLIFFYLLSYMGFTYWVVEYVTQTFKIASDAAGFGITLFWIFYAVGCFISSYAVKLIAVHKYILFSGIIAIIAYFLILVSYNATMFYIFISLLGLGCSTIFSSSISYGSLLLKSPSPRLISFFIASATVGSIVAESCTSFIQANLGLTAVIIFSAIFMIISMFILCIVIFRKI
ncbi:MAG: MFS transporter [bacterium]|nr:MFS transporter [bacterium]